MKRLILTFDADDNDACFIDMPDGSMDRETFVRASSIVIASLIRSVEAMRDHSLAQEMLDAAGALANSDDAPQITSGEIAWRTTP